MSDPGNANPIFDSHLAEVKAPSDQGQQNLGSMIEVSRHGLRLFRWGWIVFMVLATSLPYLWNAALTPHGYRYDWILPPYPQDSFGYMAWSQQAARGALLFKIKYTALPQSAFLFQPFFLICGWASRVLGCDIGVIGLVLKEVGVVLFFLVFYRYVDYLGMSSFQSVVASILLGVSSGFGGAMRFFGWSQYPRIFSADELMPDVSTYWSLLWNPLFPYSLVLMLLTIYYLDCGTREKRKADLWLAGLVSGLLALIHPYSQPLLFAFAVILIAVRTGTEWMEYLARYLAILIPCGVYLALLSALQPLVAQHSSRGAMPNFPFVSYLLGFGLLLLIWIAGFAVGEGRWMKQYWQIGVWFLLSLALAYLPVWFQRKLIFGAHVPLCIMAAVSFDKLLGRVSNLRTAKWVLAAAAIVLIPILMTTPIYLLIMQNREVRSNRTGPYYISNDMDNALKYLKQYGKPDQVVFARFDTSGFIPAFTGNTVVWGHWAMSVDLDARRRWFDDLQERQKWGDTDRARRFWDSGIEYIFADGDLETEITKTPRKWSDILQDADEVFRNDTVVIYKHRAHS